MLHQPLKFIAKQSDFRGKSCLKEKTTLPEAPTCIAEFVYYTVRYPRPGWRMLTPFPIKKRRDEKVQGPRPGPGPRGQHGRGKNEKRETKHGPRETGTKGKQKDKHGRNGLKVEAQEKGEKANGADGAEKKGPKTHCPTSLTDARAYPQSHTHKENYVTFKNLEPPTITGFRKQEVAPRTPRTASTA